MPKQVLIGETNDMLISMLDVSNRVSLVKSKVFRMCEAAKIVWIHFTPLHELGIRIQLGLSPHPL